MEISHTYLLARGSMVRPQNVEWFLHLASYGMIKFNLQTSSQIPIHHLHLVITLSHQGERFLDAKLLHHF